MRADAFCTRRRRMEGPESPVLTKTKSGGKVLQVQGESLTNARVDSSLRHALELGAAVGPLRLAGRREFEGLDELVVGQELVVLARPPGVV